jgi:hypothetical protein
MSDFEQLILSVEPARNSRGPFTLRVSRSERELFEASPQQRESYPIALPSAVQETVFMDDDGWRQRPRPAGPAQNLGLRMWSQLPPNIAGEITSGSPPSPRRVAIVSRSSGVDDVPWEWLNHGIDSEAVIAVSDAIRFVRLVPCLYSAPPVTASPRVRILTVTTNPKDERLLNPFIERQTIMAAARNHPAFEVRDLLEPRMDAFREAMEWAPHIVHYVGHSGVTGQTGAIILHDDSNGTRWVSAGELSQALPASVMLLCLSTCVTAANYQTAGLSKIAHSPNDLSLPTTIVNQYAIEQGAAAAFWGLFYPALANQRGNIVEAFHQARRQVFLTALPGSPWSWASFSLVVRDGTGFPLRIQGAGAHPRERRAAEIQAQWSARLANTVATRMATLLPEARQASADTLASEVARMQQLRGEIEKF